MPFANEPGASCSEGCPNSFSDTSTRLSVDPSRAIRGSAISKQLAVLVIAAVMSAGCTEATSPTPEIWVEVLSPLRVVGAQDSELAVLPSVRVLDAETDK